MARKIIQHSPRISVIVVVPYEDDNQILEALKAGAVQYLSRGITGESFASAIRGAFRGDSIGNELLFRPGVARLVLNELQGREQAGLSELLGSRVTEMLGYLAKGYSSEQVQQALDMSEPEITVHLASVVSRLVTNGGADTCPPGGERIREDV